MGLTSDSVGKGAADKGLVIEKNGGERVIALAGNPNVGKSTVFNALTGLNQHTGNWPGKTVTSAQGRCTFENSEYILVDLPGTYSLMAHSAEEEVARDFICFGEHDGAVVVCDATCLERNLNLVLQTIEITPKTVVCVNLLDEAEKKKIHVDLKLLSEKLGVPVIGVVARSETGLDELMRAVSSLSSCAQNNTIEIKYREEIETAISIILPSVEKSAEKKLNPRWAAVKLLDRNAKLIDSINEFLGKDIITAEVETALCQAEFYLDEQGLSQTDIRDEIISSIIQTAEDTASCCVTLEKENYYERDRRLDKILTNRIFGVPIMILMLGLVFWLTITGANYPSELISKGLFWLGDRFQGVFDYLNAPPWLSGIIVDGVYRVLAWVVSVMLPPMAIFFPLFTILEDSGYLPRVAFNLDKHFHKACACGKQALTMCMGFGCNAAGVVGCRIIDSPRERLIAIITNNFVPCNGRYPTLIAIISMFFVGASAGMGRSFLSAVLLTAVIVLGVCMTFVISRILSKTILKGVPSSFTLELPPYRRPQIGKVIVRSIFDRTIFVLGRAIAVAAPAGMIIWLMANISINDITLLTYCSEFLDPFARFIGLDGVILLAFILGFPANEIVVPIIIMAYMSEGKILELSNLSELKDLLVSNGWTAITALCTMLFSLMHWPCSTTCMTIKKETSSFKWTAASFAVPTITGIIICAVVANAGRLVSLLIN